MQVVRLLYVTHIFSVLLMYFMRKCYLQINKVFKVVIGCLCAVKGVYKILHWRLNEFSILYGRPE